MAAVHHAPVAMHYSRGIDALFSSVSVLFFSGIFSIPFDDSDSMIHRQRFSRAQCNTVVHNVGILHKCGIKIVAHTLLTPINIDYVRDIAEDIVSLGVHNWSIYQFWPFHFIADKERYIVDDINFNVVCKELKCTYRSLSITHKSYKERTLGYFFVTSLGDVYTIDKRDVLNYVYIGTIFDTDIYSKWLSATYVNGCSDIVERKIKKEFT